MLTCAGCRRRRAAGRSFCAAWLVLAVLNHLTNALVRGAACAHALWQMRQGGLWRDAWVFLAALIAPLAAWTIWRLAYYGDLLPNTFYAKVGFTWFAVQRGCVFLRRSAARISSGLRYRCSPGDSVARRRDWSQPGWVLIVAIASYSAYVIGVGGELFPAFRSLVALLPFFAILLALLVAEIAAALSQQSSAVRLSAWQAPARSCFRVRPAAVFQPPKSHSRCRDPPGTNGALDDGGAQARGGPAGEHAVRAQRAGLIAYYTNFRCDRHARC
jgi:hypothetical protein